MSIKSKSTLKSIKQIEKIMGEKLSLGRLLWAIRNSEEISQVEFAEKLSISRQYLCDLERGRRLVSPKIAVEYASILGYSPIQFVRLALQDTLDRDGLNFIIDIKAA